MLNQLKGVFHRLMSVLLAWSMIGFAAPAAAQVVGDGGEGGEEATFVYLDPAGRFTFEYPQSWGESTQPGEGIRFTGPDEFISVAIVDTGAAPVEFGESDEPALATVSTDYQGRPLRAYQVNGVLAAMREYSWQAGPSLVTGKMVPSLARRYYLPGSNGALAIFTYSSPVRSYDPEGADDFATAFKWLS